MTWPPPAPGTPQPGPAQVPATVSRRPLLRRWALVAGLAVVFGLGGWLMLRLVGTSAGSQATVLGVVLSVVVIGIVVPVFLWVDRFEAEPVGMLLFAFLWGACIATVGAAFLNSIGGSLLGAEEGSTVVAVTVAPVVEESLKGLAPLLLLLFRRREVDGVVDGIVYAGLAACGFAFVEDILYLAGGYAESGSEGLLGTFVVRVLMSPFAHPMFTICTGIGIGVAATARTGVVRVVAPVLGWGCAVVLHAVWNSATLLTEGGWLVVYVGVQIPLFLAFVGLLVWARRREARLIGRRLTPYVDGGWLTPAEAAMFASLPERRFARSWSAAHGGRPLRREMEQMQDAASELALLRHRMVRTGPDAHSLAQEHELMTLIQQRRQRFLGSAIYRRYETLGHL